MHAKLSSRVERVIELARKIAGEAEQEYLGTEHVLLAVFQEGTGVGAKLLVHFGVDEDRLKATIERFVRAGLEQTWVFGRLPGSPYLKNVVATAVEMAGELSSPEVCTEHLLLAMLKEDESVAKQVLADLGITYESARSSLEQITSKS